MLAVVILVSFKIFDDDVKKNKILQRELIRSLNQVHYLKININNDFSERVFELYLQRLDYNKRFFIREDINEFEKYKQLIDDNIDKDNFNFFDITANRIEKRITPRIAETVQAVSRYDSTFSFFCIKAA